MESLGKHCVAELYGCETFILNDEQKLIELIKESVEKSGATLLKISSHKFEPQGVTIVALLAESHFSIHTWPEKGNIAIDAFTCGSARPELAIWNCILQLKPKNYKSKLFDR